MRFEQIHWNSEFRSGAYFKVKIYEGKNAHEKRHFFFAIDRLSAHGPVRVTDERLHGPYESPTIALQPASSWLDGWSVQSAASRRRGSRRRLVSA